MSTGVDKAHVFLKLELQRLLESFSVRLVKRLIKTLAEIERCLEPYIWSSAFSLNGNVRSCDLSRS
jgi:hypothetical protein